MLLVYVPDSKRPYLSSRITTYLYHYISLLLYLSPDKPLERAKYFLFDGNITPIIEREGLFQIVMSEFDFHEKLVSFSYSRFKHYFVQPQSVCSV